MSIYDKAGEVRLWVAIFEAAQWELHAGVLTEALLETVGGADLLEHLDKDDIVDWVVGELNPGDVFDEDALKEWASENGFVDGSEPYDPEGYEERERY